VSRATTASTNFLPSDPVMGVSFAWVSGETVRRRHDRRHRSAYADWVSAAPGP
jgi:hypothetical protein